MLVAGAVAVLFLGCTPGEEAYRPGLGGRPTASYLVPQGRVLIASQGLVDLVRPGEPRKELVRVMHVRLVVENDGPDETWSIDTREQIGVLGGQQSRPAIATTSFGQPPVVSVPPRSRLLVDLYYPLPPGQQSSALLPSFDVLWAVTEPRERVSGRSTFDRIEVEAPPSPKQGWSYGWARPPGWYDPFWPEYTFDGANAPPSR